MSSRVVHTTRRRKSRPRKITTPLRAVLILIWALRPSHMTLAVMGAAVASMTYGSPHLRLKYAYQDYGFARVYDHCDYVGMQPFTLRNSRDCPLILMRRPISKSEE